MILLAKFSSIWMTLKKLKTKYPTYVAVFMNIKHDIFF